jgi:CSLREA domain-containing protein
MAAGRRLGGPGRATRPLVVVCVALVCTTWLAGCGPLVLQLNVDTTTDAVDAAPGDGVCRTAAGGCTLRAAVQEANLVGGQTRIDLQPGATYHLTVPGANEDAAATGDLDLRISVAIVGHGATIVGDGSDRVFEVGPRQEIEPDVTIDGVTFDSPSRVPQGGAILVGGGQLAVSNSTFRNGSAGDGSAIFNGSGHELFVSSSTFTDNQSAGGAAVASIGNATIGTTTFLRNQGAVHQLDGSLTLGADTFANNPASAVVIDATASASIESSTLTGNEVAVRSSGTTRLVLSTVADAPTHSNFLTTGPEVQRLAGTFTIGGSILRGDPVLLPGPVCEGGVTSIGYNLVSDASCGTTAAGDRSNELVDLEELASHGGPTATRPIHDNDGADLIPVGTPLLCDGTVFVDQRLEHRPLGPACDVGAVERQVDVRHRTFVVDSPGSTTDLLPGDGRCDVGDGTCTLQAAAAESDAVVGADDIEIAPGVDPVGGVGFVDSVSLHGDGSTRIPGVGVGSLFPSAEWVIDGVTTSSVMEQNTGHLSLIDTTVTGGHGPTPIFQLNGLLTLDRVTVRDNSLAGSGALWSVYPSRAVVSRSTFTGNSSSPPPGTQFDLGGGIVVEGATVSVLESTFAHNSSTGGMLNVIDTVQPVTIRGSLFADAGGCAIGSGASVVESYNLSTDTSCGFVGVGDHQNADAALGPLGDHGEDTLTFVPNAGSVALDAIPVGLPGICDNTSSDQRGGPRPQGAGCDIGSVERQPSDP